MISPEILRRYPFFGSLTDAQLKAMAMIGEEESFSKGSVVCEEGQPSQALFILLEGGVSLYYKTEEEFRPKTRKDFLVGEINAGEVFAISALVEPYINTATVKAEKDCRVVRLKAEELKKLIEKDPT
ncbi:MAG TPA: cyclic nucleotide-binding domain-containing protein, partial [Anaerolineales bacterium]|nr:cyclic nucleotide-binding domain-containing protein [Anaerolineales bacterium]